MNLFGIVFQSEVTRYYNAEFYRNNGFLPATTTSSRLFYISTDQLISVNNEISKREIAVYEHSFLDTSAITLFDLAARYDTYKTERYTELT